MLLPSSPNSNLAFAFCFLLPSLCWWWMAVPRSAIQSTCFKQIQPGQQQGCTSHPLTRVSERLCCMNCQGGEGHSQPPITSPKEPAPLLRHTLNGNHEATGPKAEMCLKMDLFVEVYPKPVPWLRRKCDYGNFLAQFLLGWRSTSQRFHFWEECLEAIFFFFLWWGCFKTSLYFKQQHWRLQRERAESRTARINGNFLFGWLHERAWVRQQWSAHANSFPESLSSPAHTGEWRCHRHGQSQASLLLGNSTLCRVSRCRPLCRDKAESCPYTSRYVTGTSSNKAVQNCVSSVLLPSAKKRKCKVIQSHPFPDIRKLAAN